MKRGCHCKQEKARELHPCHITKAVGLLGSTGAIQITLSRAMHYATNHISQSSLYARYVKPQNKAELT